MILLLFLRIQRKKLGTEIIKSALKAGYKVIATGREPAKLAEGLIQIASQKEPPKRWLAGADAIAEAERKASDLQTQASAYRELSSSLAL